MSQLGFFGAQPDRPPVHLYQGWLEQHRDAMSYLAERLPWEQHLFKLDVPMPRLECWFSETPSTYWYSGKGYDSHPMTEALRRLMERVHEMTSGWKANAVFANQYRDGTDSIGWHTDDEPVLGPLSQVTIASLSLGARRRFRMKHTSTGQTADWDLGEGDLLVMGPGAQSSWVHCVPKTTKPIGPRINLTFRRVRNPTSP